MHPDITALLSRCAIGVPGLHRTHPVRNLTAIAAAIVDAFDDTGPVRLGRDRRLVVIGVDGLGYEPASRALRPDVLTALTSEFPTTTSACFLTSVTGRPAHEHGVIGVRYLHPDGRRTVNCLDASLDEPTSEVPPRPTRTPDLPTVFDVLAARGVPVTVLPNELGRLAAALRGRIFRGAEIGAGVGRTGLPSTEDPRLAVAAFGDQLDAAITATPTGLVWAYLDLDTRVHRHGTDTAVAAATRSIEVLARRLADAGTAVLLFSDHGLAANRPSAATRTIWRYADDPRRCRLPAGGAGRVRWLYPHAGRADGLAGWLADRLPDAVVTSPERLATWGLLAAGSIGQRRLGEIVLLARGPDFPAPDPTAAYEHGSTTAAELPVPMAIWHPDR